MMLYIVLFAMLAAAAAAIALPLIRPPSGETGLARSAANVWRDQLAELEREERDGVIAAPQAEAARIEIQRRLLTAADAAKEGPRALSAIERRFFGYAAAGFVVIGSCVLYQANGSPDIPAAPRFARAASTTSDDVAALAAATGQSPPAVPAPAQSSAPAGAAPAGQAPAGLASVDEMIDRLAQRLEKSPGDADGWRMLGWSYSGIGRYAESAAAYAKAVALQPGNAAFRAAQGEALVNAAGGAVRADAAQAFNEAVKLDPGEPRSRYFLALAKEQAGNKQAALDDLMLLLSEAKPSDTWAGEVEEHARALASALGVAGGTAATAQAAPASGGILAKLQQEATAGASAPPPHARGEPTAADVKNAEAIPDAERSAMIRNMVDGLQRRLDASPRDAEGWIKLVRSRAVLGEPDRAKAALVRATEVFADAPQEAGRILAAAKELGVTP